MILFPNEYVELWEYGEDDSIPNFFGESTSTYTLVGVYPCDFQNMSPKDNLQEYGKILQDTYKMYIDLETPITDTMIIRIVGKEDTYKINGTPLKNNHILPHTKVLLEKQRKPTRLE